MQRVALARCLLLFAAVVSTSYGIGVRLCGPGLNKVLNNVCSFRNQTTPCFKGAFFNIESIGKETPQKLKENTSAIVSNLGDSLFLHSALFAQMMSCKEKSPKNNYIILFVHFPSVLNRMYWIFKLWWRIKSSKLLHHSVWSFAIARSTKCKNKSSFMASSKLRTVVYWCFFRPGEEDEHRRRDRNGVLPRRVLLFIHKEFLLLFVGVSSTLLSERYLHGEGYSHKAHVWFKVVIPRR